MHEVYITENIIKMSTEEAVKHNASKVSEIRIKVGELSGLVPECIQLYFDIMSKGTIVEGAQLKVEKMPVVIKCNECETETPVGKGMFKCPNCGSTNIKVIGGHEFLFDSMEVE